MKWIFYKIGGNMYAFIMIQLKKTDEKEIIDELKKNDHVEEIFVCFGDWDILAKIKFTDADDLGDFMIKNIRSRDDVKTTQTLIAATQDLRCEKENQ